MTFLPIKDVPPPSPHELVCRQSRLIRSISLGFFVAIFVALLLIPAQGAIRWVVWGIAAIFFLFVWAFGKMLYRTFGTQNWVMRVTPTRVLIKFRSFANSHFSEDDEVIIQISPHEIAWVGILKEHLKKPAEEDQAPTTDRSTCVELGLKGIDTQELSRRLSEERANMGPGTYVRTRYGDYPVRLVDGVLRVQWRGSMGFVVPSAKRVVAALAKSPSTEERATQHRTLDLATPADDKAAMETQIIELVERGDRMAATKLIRKRYGCTLTEAKEMVEQLCSPAPRQS